MFAKNNRRLLLLAMALAIICSAVGYVYLKQLEANAVATPLEAVVMVKIPVEAGRRLTEDMLSVEKVPVDAIHPNAIRSLSQAVGKITRTELVAGEQLLQERIVPGAERPALAYRVPEGLRAVTIGVDERIAVALMLNPGDRVDVSVSYLEEKPDGQASKKTLIILQNLEVLAVGQRLETKNTPDNPSMVQTLTLAVTPEQAEKLVWAEEFGRIRLLLRSPVDRAASATPGVTAETFR